MKSTPLEQVIDISSPVFDALLDTDPIAVADARPNRSRLAVLYLRHRDPRDDRTPQPDGCTANYHADVDEVTPDACMIHPAPLSHGAGILRRRLCRQRRQ